MPFLFPEVFLRDDPGFDVLIGNPPWEKLKVEEHAWWGLRFPGLRSMAQKAKNAELVRLKEERPDLRAEYEADVEQSLAARSIVGAGPFPGMGRGDLDLYQAFAWRNWQLLRRSGRFGLVLPRGALSGSALAGWRNAILDDGYFPDVCFITNTGRWAFDMEPRYTIAFTVAARGDGEEVSFTGPFASEREFVEGGPAHDHHRGRLPHVVQLDRVPAPARSRIRRILLTDEGAPPLRRRRDGFEFRPHRELHATNDKAWFDFDLEHPQWRPTGARGRVVQPLGPRLRRPLRLRQSPDSSPRTCWQRRSEADPTTGDPPSTSSRFNSRRPSIGTRPDCLPGRGAGRPTAAR